MIAETLEKASINFLPVTSESLIFFYNDTKRLEIFYNNKGKSLLEHFKGWNYNEKYKIYLIKGNHIWFDGEFVFINANKYSMPANLNQFIKILFDQKIEIEWHDNVVEVFFSHTFTRAVIL